jgi:hypothetical protein
MADAVGKAHSQSGEKVVDEIKNLALRRRAAQFPRGVSQSLPCSARQVFLIA